MMAIVFLPAQLRDLTGGVDRVDVEARTLRALMDALEAQFPGIRSRLCEGNAVAPGLQVSIDQVLTSRLSTPLEPGSEVHFLPALGGGQ